MLKNVNKNVAVLVYNWFEQDEFVLPINALRSAGIRVTTIAADTKQLQAMQQERLGDRYKADILLKNADADDFDALILPGGVINSDKLRMIDKARRWALKFLREGRPVAAICHAPWLLVSADCVEERRLTSYHTIQDDIRNAGGEWVDMPVIIDNNLITSRAPKDLVQFNRAIVRALNSQKPMAASFMIGLE